MKIAYVITRSDEIGGAHVHVRDLALWLIKHGHSVKVFVGGAGVFTDGLSDVNVPFESLAFLKRPVSPVNDLRAVGELKRALQCFEPDIVSIHSAKAGIIGRLACRIAGLPCIFTAHGWAFADGVKWPAKQLYRLLERGLAGSAKAIITVCEADRTLAISNRVASADHLVAIHNGMPELVVCQDQLPERLDGPPTLVMVARFESQKDHETLVRALGMLSDLRWRLQLIGDGPLLPRIRSLVTDLELDARVEFLGRRRDVPDILYSSDIFVLTTHWEGFPRSILEAMRAGLPVVATEVAGIPESVDHGVTGFLVPKDEPAAVAKALSGLITDPELRRTLGNAGRKAFCEHFTFDQMASKTEALYQQCLQEVAQ